MLSPTFKNQNPLPSLEDLKSRLQDFCRTRPITRLEIFGSVARGEARPESDIDLKNKIIKHMVPYEILLRLLIGM